MDSRTAAGLAVVGVSLACGCCSTPTSDARPPPPDIPETPEARPRPVREPPKMALLTAVSEPPQLGRSVSVDTENESSPEQAGATLEPPTAIVTQPGGTPLRTAIGRFTPVVKGTPRIHPYLAAFFPPNFHQKQAHRVLGI